MITNKICFTKKFEGSVCVCVWGADRDRHTVEGAERESEIERREREGGGRRHR